MLIRIAFIALGLIFTCLTQTIEVFGQETTTANTMTGCLARGGSPGFYFVAGGTDWSLDYSGRIGRSGEVLGW